MMYVDETFDEWYDRVTQTWVYYAERDGLIKIGLSLDPKRRVRDLGATLLAQEPGSFADERARHRQFVTSRDVGEWFVLTPELMEWITELQSEAS